MQWYVPASSTFQYVPLNARSVPACWVTSYCSGVRRCFSSSSVGMGRSAMGTGCRTRRTPCTPIGVFRECSATNDTTVRAWRGTRRGRRSPPSGASCWTQWPAPGMIVLPRKSVHPAPGSANPSTPGIIARTRSRSPAMKHDGWSTVAPVMSALASTSSAEGPVPVERADHADPLERRCVHVEVGVAHEAQRTLRAVRQHRQERRRRAARRRASRWAVPRRSNAKYTRFSAARVSTANCDSITPGSWNDKHVEEPVGVQLIEQVDQRQRQSAACAERSGRRRRGPGRDAGSPRARRSAHPSRGRPGRPARRRARRPLRPRRPPARAACTARPRVGQSSRRSRARPSPRPGSPARRSGAT